jgi:hypothetical protein
MSEYWLPKIKWKYKPTGKRVKGRQRRKDKEKRILKPVQA